MPSSDRLADALAILFRREMPSIVIRIRVPVDTHGGGQPVVDPRPDSPVLFDSAGCSYKESRTLRSEFLSIPN